jgi:glyoxylase-like metal-dependent hydrolase (beta-lactamase superfamily II)
LEGSAYSLLIDTTTGAGDLRAFVRELTDKPVHVALTHGHGDHSGGVFHFGICSMHPDDARFMYDDATAEHRKFHIDRANGGSSFVRYADLHPLTAVKTYPIYDGDVFDIGSRTLEVIHVPGHSLGSVMFLERAAKVIYGGDAANPGVLLYLDGSTDVKTYKNALLHLQKFSGLWEKMWWGHGDEWLPPRIVDECLMLCDKILDGTDDSEERGFYRAPFLFARKQGKNDGLIANIGYRKDWIAKAPPYRMAPLPPTDDYVPPKVE